MDDDPLMREIASEYLRQVGFTVTLAKDGQEALDATSEWLFDLIVTDMVMPNVNGLELIRAIKERAPTTPVIAMSSGIGGVNAELLLRAATAAGAVSALAKPLLRSAFLREVASVLAGARLPLVPMPAPEQITAAPAGGGLRRPPIRR